MKEKEEVLEEEAIEDIVEEEEREETDKIEETEEREEIEEDEKDLEIKELKDRYLRLQADFVNYKNRVEKEKERIYLYSKEDLFIEILPIIDNFERALENNEVNDGFYEGVEMIYNQLIEMLKSNDLNEIECLGKSFDPNFHHAVFMEEVEGVEEGIVLEVLQKGYILKDKVLRPSMVKVSE